MPVPHEQVLRADAARNYERIVVAAGRAFEEAGPAVTLEEVARRAGVGVATVYRRFRSRDQLVRAVFTHLLTEVEPAAVETDDPWQDLVGFLHATVDVLAGREVILALAREADSIDVRVFDRCVRLISRLVQRAVAAGLVRPELEARDVAAVIVMILAVVHPDDVDGADRRRYLTLLTDGLRPAPTTLPPASTTRTWD
ncbi:MULTISPECIES: TetR/AcrR family transcriptional regulator [Actinoalloteichus]|uniref:Transcriptional regulator, TetR family n=1 Tax=Actinoalloteichus fjordicus TaxID=1612552 RepID=A0AAC9L973_9PSEU|nr:MULTISPECIES: TetR/AcrR family transcriptional regulator [Actinoalloteichus]APU13246.1 transcriptional regulator, TetR family [Actinoalloteichus fjordicus]APU19197.1 transcriptional regulator, TetR family [Actinoalloteichus sp. GBA129-24]